MAVTILIAEDHRVVREGLRALIEAEPDLSVVAETDDGLEAVELTRQHKPDVLLLDLMLRGLSGLDVALQVSQRMPKTRVVVLSMHSNEAYVLQALKNGAIAYVVKDSSSSELLHAIREAVAGQRYLSTRISQRAIDAYLSATGESGVDPYDALTNREREVFALAAEGRSNNEIGARLSISPRTVEVHRGNMMRKLNLHGQEELIRYARARGVLLES